MYIKKTLKTACFALTLCTMLCMQAGDNARALREKAYHALSWFALTTAIYFKMQDNYPLISGISGLCALTYAINALHYFHESLHADHEAETMLEIVKRYTESMRDQAVHIMVLH